MEAWPDLGVLGTLGRVAVDPAVNNRATAEGIESQRRRDWAQRGAAHLQLGSLVPGSEHETTNHLPPYVDGQWLSGWTDRRLAKVYRGKLVGASVLLHRALSRYWHSAWF